MAAIGDCMISTNSFNLVTRQDSSLVSSLCHATHASYLLLRDIAQVPIRVYDKFPDTDKARFGVTAKGDVNAEKEIQGGVELSKFVGAY